jgi:phospholipid transport system transporter-binding protein
MLTLPPVLTHREACATLEALAQALVREEGGSLVIDASGLHEFDTSALAVLIECQRRARAAGRSVELRSPPPKLSSLARLYGVEPLLMPGAATAAA